MNANQLFRARVPLVLLLLVLGFLIVAFRYDSEAQALPVLVAWTTLALLLLEVLVQSGSSFGGRLQSFLQGSGSSRESGAEPEAVSGAESGQNFRQESEQPIDHEPTQVPIARALLHAFVWPGFLLVLTVLIGILPAVLVYVFASLKIVAGKTMTRSLSTSLAVTTFAWVLFEWGLSYQLYRGMLVEAWLGY